MIKSRLAALAAVTALALSACGTIEPPASTEAQNNTGSPVTVTDSRGKEITLDAPARRVVVLEWGEAEMLRTLGVMPVGVADIEGYRSWVTAEKLGDSVEEVGMRGEPSVESIVALDPDLVISEQLRGTGALAQLEKHVPVLVTKGSDATDNLGRMRQDFTMIAKAVGKAAEAERILADFDAALADAKQKIADAGAAGESFVIADGWQEGSAVAIRPFAEGSLVSQVAIRLGLTNAWPGKGDTVWGLGQTDVEGLTTITDDDVHFLYNGTQASDADIDLAEALAGNPIWQSLPFVKQDRVHRLPDGIWTFGGPASCQQYADALVKIFAA